MSIVDAVRSGHVAGLEAMRDKLAEAMDEAEPSVVAQVAGRLQAVLKELAEISDGAEVTLTDVLAERRAARVAAAKPKASAGAGRNKRSG